MRSENINLLNEGKETLTESDLATFKSLIDSFVFDVLGLKNESDHSSGESVEALMDLILELRKEAKAKKDFTVSDLIRDKLLKAGIQVMDTKEGAVWKPLN